MTGKLIQTETFAGQQYIVKRNMLAGGTYIMVFRTVDGVVVSRQEVVFE